MITIRKDGAELQMSHEDVQHLTPDTQAQLAQLLAKIADGTRQPQAQNAATHTPPSVPIATPPVPAPAKRRSSGTSYRVPRPEDLPANADPLERAKMLLRQRPRSHKEIDAHLARHLEQGATTVELMAIAKVSQTEVSRAVSGLRRIEESAPLPPGSLVHKSKGKTPRWTAGPLLVEFCASETARN